MAFGVVMRAREETPSYRSQDLDQTMYRLIIIFSIYYIPFFVVLSSYIYLVLTIILRISVIIADSLHRFLRHKEVSNFQRACSH